MATRAGDEFTDVIVVGAGLAGLAAAGEIQAGGLSVRMLEADDESAAGSAPIWSTVSGSTEASSC
jgi:monoamine oxidase